MNVRTKVEVIQLLYISRNGSWLHKLSTVSLGALYIWSKICIRAIVISEQLEMVFYV